MDEKNKNNSVPASRKDSVETYKDLTKLIITLSTGIFILSPAFLGFVELSNVSFLSILFLSWLSQLFSIIFGLLTFSTLAGTQSMNEYDINNKYTKCFSRGQWIAFVIGILLFGIFVVFNLRDRLS
ncbi:MAG: hypothetical protein JRJ66_02890 [Deltaproteobacteria bacterium]|nr:hypothetical protein [Deltaproteobacteria bacterium]